MTLTRSTSSCDASCYICFPKVLCASATLVSSPTAGARCSCRFVFTQLGLAPQRAQANMTRFDSNDLWRCPMCGGPMVVVERLTAAEIQLRSPSATGHRCSMTPLSQTRILHVPQHIQSLYASPFYKPHLSTISSRLLARCFVAFVPFHLMDVVCRALPAQPPRSSTPLLPTIEFA